MLKLIKENNHRYKRERSKMPQVAQELYKQRPLTNEEIVRVQLATIREGVNHCRWPRDVIEQFLAVQA